MATALQPPHCYSHPLQNERRTTIPFTIRFAQSAFLAIAVVILPGVVLSAERKTLSDSMPPAAATLRPVGPLTAVTNLYLAIGLPLRNRPALTNLIDSLYDPASPSFRHWLTSTDFTDQFGPTDEDYRKVIQFAQQHALKVVGTHPNRLLLDVTGPVA